MLLNEDIIRDAIETANCILETLFNTYERPRIHKITISKARSWWAQIEKIPQEGVFNLKVSNIFNDITDNNEAHDKLISTMLHELVHTIPGCWNHKNKFKAYASIINAHWPKYYVGRATTAKSLIEKPREFKYIITCKHCGRKNFYLRKPQIYDFCKFNHTPFICNICGKDSFEGIQLR